MNNPTSGRPSLCDLVISVPAIFEALATKNEAIFRPIAVFEKSSVVKLNFTITSLTKPAPKTANLTTSIQFHKVW